MGLACRPARTDVSLFNGYEAVAYRVVAKLSLTQVSGKGIFSAIHAHGFPFPGGPGAIHFKFANKL